MGEKPCANRLVEAHAGKLLNGVSNDALQLLTRILDRQKPPDSMEDSLVKAAIEDLAANNIAWDYFEPKTAGERTSQHA